MTVKLLMDWPDSRDGKQYVAGNLLTTDAGTETGLVDAKMATTTLTGGTAYVAPAVQAQYLPVMASANLTGGIDLLIAGAPAKAKLIGPSSKLLACIPARDTGTVFKDITAMGNNLVVEAGNTGAFATEGYFNTTASTTGGLNIPQSKILWNPVRESFILSFVLKRARPAGHESVLTVGAVAANYQGFYLSHRNAAGGPILAVALNNAGGTVAVGAGAWAGATAGYSDATPKDRVCTIAFDATTGDWFMWRDGILGGSFLAATKPGGVNTFTDQVTLAQLRVGALDQVSGVAAVAGVQGYGLQFAKYVGALPLNIGMIAARLAETPRAPISEMEW